MTRGWVVGSGSSGLFVGSIPSSMFSVFCDNAYNILTHISVRCGMRTATCPSLLKWLVSSVTTSTGIEFFFGGGMLL